MEKDYKTEVKIIATNIRAHIRCRNQGRLDKCKSVDELNHAIQNVAESYGNTFTEIENDALSII